MVSPFIAPIYYRYVIEFRSRLIRPHIDTNLTQTISVIFCRLIFPYLEGRRLEKDESQLHRGAVGRRRERQRYCRICHVNDTAVT